MNTPVNKFKIGQLHLESDSKGTATFHKLGHAQVREEGASTQFMTARMNPRWRGRGGVPIDTQSGPRIGEGG